MQPNMLDELSQVDLKPLHNSCGCKKSWLSATPIEMPGLCGKADFDLFSAACGSVNPQLKKD